MKSWRSIEQQAEKTSKELDIRTELRKWDELYPMLHHELIIRYLSAYAASYLSHIMYDWFMSNFGNSSRRYDRRYR